VFRSSRDGVFNLYVVPADGSEDARRLTTSASEQTPYEFTAEGALLFGQAQAGTGLDVLSMRLEPGATPVPVLSEPFDEGRVSVAPGGRFLAYESWDLGYPEVFVRALGEPGGRRLVSTLDVEPANAMTNADPREARSPLWSRDGTTIFYQAGRAFVSAPMGSDDAAVRGSPELFQADYARHFPVVGGGMRHFDAAPDGQRLLIIDTGGSLGDAGPNQLVVVQNWLGLLEARE
jgi:Tol biopolymer transport system component